MLKQTSQLKNDMISEGAWRHLNPTLLCGQNKMKLKTVGHEAADLQLDIGIVIKPCLSEVLSFMVKALNA